MALFGLDLGGLEETLNKAVINSGSTRSSSPSETASTIGTSLYGGLSSWFQKSVFPLVMTILVFVTILFVFYGSYQYFTAYGNEAKAESAKKTITFAIVGFIIAILAFSISTYTQRIIIKKEYENGVAVPVEETITADTSAAQPWNSDFVK